MFAKVKAGINKGILSASIHSGTYLETEKLKSKINDEEKNVNIAINKLGHLVFEKWKNNSLDLSELNQHCQAIDNSKKSIASLQDKIHQLAVEKNKILETVNASQAPLSMTEYMKSDTELSDETDDENTILCSCGNKCNATDKFCMNCGKILNTEEENNVLS